MCIFESKMKLQISPKTSFTEHSIYFQKQYLFSCFNPYLCNHLKNFVHEPYTYGGFEAAVSQHKK